MDRERGVLYPAQLPEFHRELPAPDATALVSWYWMPQWDLLVGRTSRQHVVSYPAMNLVVQPDGVELAGPTTRASFRDLTGRGWAVGALLRPAAAAALTETPAQLRDRSAAFPAPHLHHRIVEAMARGGEEGRRRAAAVFTGWLTSVVGDPGPTALLANRMSDLLMSDATVLRAEDAAVRMSVSLRTLQRIAHRYVGVPPAAMIRRRRLQEAAQRLREDPAIELSVLAAELGYADHAHLTNDFRTVLAVTPRDYRSGGAPVERTERSRSIR